MRVHISDGALCITSGVQEPAPFDERLGGERTTDSGTPGLEPSLLGDATRIGWTLRHRVEGDRVSLVVESTGVRDGSGSPVAGQDRGSFRQGKFR